MLAKRWEVAGLFEGNNARALCHRDAVIAVEMMAVKVERGGECACTAARVYTGFLGLLVYGRNFRPIFRRWDEQLCQVKR
jgi:hypothetical protein